MALPTELSSLRTLEEIERDYIARVLRYHQGNRTHTARTLGIARRTLLYKIRRYRL